MKSLVLTVIQSVPLWEEEEEEEKRWGHKKGKSNSRVEMERQLLLRKVVEHFPISHLLWCSKNMSFSNVRDTCHVLLKLAVP